MREKEERNALPSHYLFEAIPLGVDGDAGAPGLTLRPRVQLLTASAVVAKEASGQRPPSLLLVVHRDSGQRSAETAAPVQ
jgi:hypothetical protein